MPSVHTEVEEIASVLLFTATEHNDAVLALSHVNRSVAQISSVLCPSSSIISDSRSRSNSGTDLKVNSRLMNSEQDTNVRLKSTDVSKCRNLLQCEGLKRNSCNSTIYCNCIRRNKFRKTLFVIIFVHKYV